jgi:hypothetical protein
MAPRKPKVRPQPQMVRDRFRAMHNKYGIEQLIQWYNEDCESPSRVGRPPRVMSWFKQWSEPVLLNGPRRKKRRIAILVWREI